MYDKNGIEIKTGMVVRVSNAYFKTDNGLFFVTHSPNDPTWCGRYYSLHKLGKTGKVSTTKYNVGSWPVTSYVNDALKSALCADHNKQYAEIEVIKDFQNTKEIANYFANLAHEIGEQLEWMEFHWGKGNEYFAAKERHDFFKAVSDSLR